MGIDFFNWLFIGDNGKDFFLVFVLFIFLCCFFAFFNKRRIVLTFISSICIAGGCFTLFVIMAAMICLSNFKYTPGKFVINKGLDNKWVSVVEFSSSEKFLHPDDPRLKKGKLVSYGKKVLDVKTETFLFYKVTFEYGGTPELYLQAVNWGEKIFPSNPEQAVHSLIWDFNCQHREKFMGFNPYSGKEKLSDFLIDNLELLFQESGIKITKVEVFFL
ncbi:hypothetical protein KKC45_02125 [Patescibacteria group bacterium]|nr:hypothetical protein [Patescibacteria group bacterium]